MSEDVQIYGDFRRGSPQGISIKIKGKSIETLLKSDFDVGGLRQI